MLTNIQSYTREVYFAIWEVPLNDAKIVRKQIKSFKIEQKAVLLKIDKQGFRHVAHSLQRVSLATPQSCIAGQLNAELL